MPSYLNVYNTSLETVDTQFKSKGYSFKPRSLTKLPEEFDFAIPEYFKRGLVVINPGDDLEAKEREGLVNYLGWLMERRAYHQYYLDEKKRAGVTVDKPRAMLQIEQWIDEIKAKYSGDNTFQEMQSFKDSEPLDAKQLFAGEMAQKSVEQIVNESITKKPKSFKEVDITKEIRA